MIYNVQLVDLGISIIVLFFVCSAGLIIPPYTFKFLQKEWLIWMMKAFKLFGSGVLISTAYIHMLQPSVELLSHDCLPSWVTGYAWSGFLAMAGMLFGLGLQVFYPTGHVHHYMNLDISPATESFELSTQGHRTAFLLELGVASHSVLIGMILGAKPIHERYSFLAAVSFHQFFEGMALSSVLVENLDWPTTLILFFICKMGLSRHFGYSCWCCIGVVDTK